MCIDIIIMLVVPDKEGMFLNNRGIELFIQYRYDDNLSVLQYTNTNSMRYLSISNTYFVHYTYSKYDLSVMHFLITNNKPQRLSIKLKH